ncbi:acid protease [Irpex rosettiformis]|uniref:Acid protease n=1 Tax=Irpex rosettiformis TaxID=378272 RepID=A0ACB8U198_9APHY|nr:acid protease [Irpex rosettiformis]
MATALPFVSRIVGNHAKEILARDRARAQKLLSGKFPHGPSGIRELRAKRGHHHHPHHPGKNPGGGDTDPGKTPGGDEPTDSGAGVDVTDAGVTYTASVGVGNPATQYTLLIDTGVSNTWIGADKSYKKTTTSKSTGATVVRAASMFSDFYLTDTVTLAADLVIKNQSIGVANQAQGFNDVDGILGIGPVDLTVGTVSTGQPVPTVTDNLFSQGTISSDSIGISYQPTTSTGAVNGELNFGGVDTSKITGDVTYVPITSTSPASQYWGIDQTISYGDNSSVLDSTAGIVDTGTTLVLIATDAFQKYQRLTGAKEDQSTGLLTLTERQFENLQSLFFNIGGISYELTANAQIWPRSLNSTIGGEEGKIYLVVSDLGSPSGEGLDFINGFTFLQRFYSVYDTGNTQVGLATTPFTDATTN